METYIFRFLVLKNKIKTDCIKLQIISAVVIFTIYSSHLETLPGVSKMGNFIDLDVLFPNFNFA